MAEHMKDFVYMKKGDVVERVPCEPTDEIIIRMNDGWVQVREEDLKPAKGDK